MTANGRIDEGRRTAEEGGHEGEWPPSPGGRALARALERFHTATGGRSGKRVSGSLASLHERLEDHLLSYDDCWRTPPGSPLQAWTLPFEGRILEVGCGFGQVLLALSREGTPSLMVGVDLDRDLLRFGGFVSEAAPAGARVPRLVAADALKLPFAERSFDVVICRVVLMSLPVCDALKELARLVTEGGRLYLHLTGPGYYIRDLWGGRWKGSLLALSNGTLLSLFSRQMRVKGLWNNFQPMHSVRRILETEGLSVVSAERVPPQGLFPVSVKLLATRRRGRHSP